MGKEQWEGTYAPALRDICRGREKAGELWGVFRLESLTELRFTDRGQELAGLVRDLMEWEKGAGFRLPADQWNQWTKAV